MDGPATPETKTTGEVAAVADALKRARQAIQGIIRGKDEMIELALVAMVGRGHLLLEDIPGVGKSTLARALARAVDGSFRRVQFTSDLLPADLVGVNVWRSREERFEFREGPVFANMVLADEVNRAPPRTQSALLEAMGEMTVSIDGVSHDLPDPFMVIATQNPAEHHGTYPLPESQRDRFMLRVRMGYAGADVETALLQAGGTRSDADLKPVVSREEVLAAQRLASEVFVHEDLARYAQQVVQATRDHAQVALGVSTRGALGWMAAARGRALLEGRDRILIDDLQELAVPALAHRLMASQSAAGDVAVSEEIVRDVVARTPVPV